jgi:cysteine-rich repeat protein
MNLNRVEAWLSPAALASAVLLPACMQVAGISKHDLPSLDGETRDTDADTHGDGACGNGVVDGGEECDDGNDLEGDGCDGDCTFSCALDADCRDEDLCNGSEACDPGTHACRAGDPPGDGFVCGNMPRYICLEGDCTPSLCGDGFVDGGAGESCEPPGTATCDEGCRQKCVTNDDCPDDGNVCNGEEFCDTGEGLCSNRNTPPQGTECGASPRRICVGGACRESACGDGYADAVASEECDDGADGDDADGCRDECTYTCHNDTECDDGLGCTDDLCLTAVHLCYGEVSAAGRACRASAGDCDLEELCDGASADCPPDAFRGSDERVLCRPSDGDCDLPDYCDGTGPSCPADVRQPGTVVCRASAGACDAPELCDGASSACPADALFTTSRECRPAAVGCDLTEFCTGSSIDCPPDQTACGCTGNPDCPDDGNMCNGTEYCDTVSHLCARQDPPGDWAECAAVPRSFCWEGSCHLSVCGDLIVDAAMSEDCDDGNSVNGDGCENDCSYSCSAAAECGDGYLCTVDVCNPVTHICSNTLVPASAHMTCRAAAGSCDVAEECNGIDRFCPVDGFRPSSYVCRSSGRICDPSERCTGSSPLCPPDEVACWATVDGGHAHTCAVMEGGGALYCWGDNERGMLGTGDIMARLLPTAVLGTVSSWARVSAGDEHTCGIAADGALYCWGGNDYGQLGNGTTSDRTTPARVGTYNDWVTVAAGSFHTCGIRQGTVYCWGRNHRGQVGDNTTTSRSSPTAVYGSFSAGGLVSCGGNHSCAVNGSLDMYCWGNNSSGQLGDGTVIEKHVPTRVDAARTYDWEAVSAGSNHTCGVSTGSFYCWGINSTYQLGDGTTNNATLPRMPSFTSGPQMVAAAAGAGHTCGVRELELGLYCWGLNDNGQVGDGTSTDRPAPVLLGMTEWSLITAGDPHTCGIGEGVLYCWGDNWAGQLGDGTTENREEPHQVSTPAPP